MRKLISFESTAWNEPSVSVARKSESGYPAMTPFSAASRTPFSTAGQKLRGTEPPTMRVANSTPLPGNPLPDSVIESIAHTGVAMGRAGSDLALDTAAAVIMLSLVMTMSRSGITALALARMGMRARNLDLAAE